MTPTHHWISKLLVIRLGLAIRKKRNVIWLSIIFLFLASCQAWAQYTVGQTVGFVITANNGTAQTWNQTKIVDTLPTNLTYVSCSGGTSCSDVSGTVIWNIGTVSAYTSSSVTLWVYVNSCVPSSFLQEASVDVGSPFQSLLTNSVNDAVTCLTNTPTMTSTTTVYLTPTQTFSPTVTDSFTATPSYTNTFTASSTFTATSTFSPTPTATITFTPTQTFTFTSTNTLTITSTYTNTFTPSFTPTGTNSFTTTFTPTITSTYSPPPSYTPTCVTYVWPDPFDSRKAVGGTLRISCMNPESVVTIYTVSGELVQTLNYQTSPCQTSNMWGMTYCWNGRNQMGMLVSEGIYLYVIQQGNQITQRGKFLLVNQGY